MFLSLRSNAVDWNCVGAICFRYDTLITAPQGAVAVTLPPKYSPTFLQLKMSSVCQVAPLCFVNALHRLKPFSLLTTNKQDDHFIAEPTRASSNKTSTLFH